MQRLISLSLLVVAIGCSNGGNAPGGVGGASGASGLGGTTGDAGTGAGGASGGAGGANGAGGTGGVNACGSTTCPAGQVCCNASCGLCTAPGGSCIEKVCSDLRYYYTCGRLVCNPSQPRADASAPST